MNILRVIASVNPEGGGPIEGVRQISAFLSKQGHTTEVVCLDDPNINWVLDFPHKVYAMGPVKSTYGYSSLLLKWLQENAKSYDVVIVHGIWQYHSFATCQVL